MYDESNTYILNKFGIEINDSINPDCKEWVVLHEASHALIYLIECDKLKIPSEIKNIQVLTQSNQYVGCVDAMPIVIINDLVSDYMKGQNEIDYNIKDRLISFIRVSLAGVVMDWHLERNSGWKISPKDYLEYCLTDSIYNEDLSKAVSAFGLYNQNYIPNMDSLYQLNVTYLEGQFNKVVEQINKYKEVLKCINTTILIKDVTEGDELKKLVEKSYQLIHSI